MLGRKGGMGGIRQSGETRRRSLIPTVGLFPVLTGSCFGDKCVLVDIVPEWKMLPFVYQFLYFLWMIESVPLVRFSCKRRGM